MKPGSPNITDHAVRMKSLFAFALLLLNGFLFANPAEVSLGRQEQEESEQSLHSVVVLGNERLFDDYAFLLEARRVGIITNQTGIDSRGRLTYRRLADAGDIALKAIFVPEHGLDGLAKAGEYIESYQHQDYGIPVYSLYNDNRKPTPEMLNGIDMLLFDIQDIGSRAYTYISTMNYAMQAAAENNITFVVLDRPNPLGDRTEGFVLEQGMESFVGVDTLPLAHGMTVGELAQYFNREIGAELIIVPMKHYFRDMLYYDTGLPWVMTSPNIPDLESAFCYMATGMGEGTGVYQKDTFRWVGSRDLDDGYELAARLNQAGLPGVTFRPEERENFHGVRLVITDYRAFNPCLTSINILYYTKYLTGFSLPRPGSTLFEKLWGTYDIVHYLESGTPPSSIINSYKDELEQFRSDRAPYLIYPERPPGW